MREIVNGAEMPAVTAGIDEHFRLVSGTISLEAHVSAPAAPVRAAVLCHPHPQYGGSMDNNVVLGVARALRAAEIAVLRFNFRGVGQSGGHYADGVGEVQDVEAAVGDTARRFPGIPLTLAGYSFGAAVALRAGYCGLQGLTRMVAIAPPVSLVDMTFLRECRVPVCFVAGDRDSFCPRNALDALVAGVPGASVSWVEGADHFFAGSEARVAVPVRACALSEVD